MSKLAMAYMMKKRAKKMDEGGEVEAAPEEAPQEEGEATEPAEQVDKEKPKKKEEQDQQAQMPVAPPSIQPGTPGEIPMMSQDIVDRIIARRMSRGGMIANDVGISEADEHPAEYDDLVLRDGLEFSYDDANSGDELGDAAQDERDRDIIARIMRSRAKRDRMPRPA